jgi:isocitrate dehydrogenase
MTKDLSILIGPKEPFLNTIPFLDRLDQRLKKAMA